MPATAGDTGDMGLISGSGRSPADGNGNHSRILAWKIPWTEGPGGLQSMGLWRARHKWALTAHSTRITKIRICFRGDVFLGKCFLLMFWASLVAQLVKNPPAMQETCVQSLGWKDSLEKEMASHSSILAWKIPWTEGPGGLQSMESQRAGHSLPTE